MQTNILGCKPRIQLTQFFKYGFAEQKMMMCVDTIKRVKALHKEIRINQSLSSTRKSIRRSASATKPRFMDSSVQLVKRPGGRTLAEIQEDMKADF